MKNLSKFLAFIALLLTSSLSYAQDNPIHQNQMTYWTPSPGEGYVAYYSGDNATNNCLFLIGISKFNWRSDWRNNLAGNVYHDLNDEIRSVVLVGPIKAGSKFWLYDTGHEDNKFNDDWIEITVNSNIPQGVRHVLHASSAGANQTTGYVTIVKHPIPGGDGMQGKVSRVEGAPVL